MQGKSRKRVRVAILAVLLTTLGMIGIGAIAASQADAATTPLSVTLNACGAGSTAVWDTHGSAQLTAGSAAIGTCGELPGQTWNPAFAEIDLNGVAGAAIPASAPTFTTDAYAGGDPRLVIFLNNGGYIWTEQTTAAQSADPAALIWQFEKGTSSGTTSAIGSYKDAVAAAGSTTVKSATVLTDNGEAGKTYTVSALQYNGQTLKDGGTVSLVRPDDVDNVLGHAIVPIQLSATTNVSDQHLVYSASNLPAGLSIDQSKGVITGTPTHTGGTLVTVTSTNDYGQSDSETFAVRVASHAPEPLHPYVYNGRVVTVNNNRATVTWNASDRGWPDSQNKCEEVWISGYGFGAWDPANPTNPGTSHVGFTCVHDGSNVNFGYLSGLAAGHTYALRIVPATGVYGNNKPIPGAHVAYVDVFTTR